MVRVVFKNMPKQTKFTTMADALIRWTDDGQALKIGDSKGKYQFTLHLNSYDIDDLIEWLATNYTDQFNEVPRTKCSDFLKMDEHGNWIKDPEIVSEMKKREIENAVVRTRCTACGHEFISSRCVMKLCPYCGGTLKEDEERVK